MKNLIFTNFFKNSKNYKKFKNLKIGLWAENKLVSSENNKKYYYRWSDPIKFKNDIHKIKIYYRVYLKEIAKNLNKYHSENYSSKYWEIIIGPWLHTFISVIYDRYYSLQQIVLENKSIDSSSYFIFDDIMQRPKNTDQFFIFSQTDLWNQFLFQKIAENMKIFKNIKRLYKKNSSLNFIDNKILYNYSDRKPKFLNTLFKKIIFILLTKFRKTHYIFFLSGLSRKTILSIFIKKNNFISTSLFDFHIKKNKQNRNFDFIEIKPNEIELEKILRILINELIPESFVESYIEISKKLSRKYTFKPKVIFTSFGYKIYDCFKIWTAKNNYHNNSKLIVYQHGNFGTYENALDEDHQISISNLYFSWGWKYPSKKNIKPFYTPFNYSGKNSLEKINKIMMVTAVKSKYAGTLFTGYHSSAWSKYVDFLDSFLNNSSIKIKSNLVIKGYHHDYGWDYTKILKKKHKDISIFDKSTNFGELVNSYKLNIITYNGTSLLQSLSSGNPTIILWDSSIWRPSSISKKYFKMLYDTQILFDDIVNASNHLNKIYDDIDNWWNQKTLQNKLKSFVSNFSRYTNSFDKELIEEISKINYD